MRRTLSIALAIAALLVAGLLGCRLVLVSFFYPKPKTMPPVVSATTEQLLLQLQSVLEKRAPEVLLSLQQGLLDKQISELEAKGGFILSPDLRAFYKWRNGTTNSTQVSLIPGHRFLPLEEVVA